MASLTSCMKKAGEYLHPEDKKAVLERARELRKSGMSNIEAAKQALQERFDHVGGMLDEMGRTYDQKDNRPPAEDDTPKFTFKESKDGSLLVKGDVEQIRSMLPPGITGRLTNEGLVFSNTAAHRVRSALEGLNLTYSREGKVLGKLPVKNGRYVGAPAKFDTPGKIPTLRKWLRKLALEGEPGRFWYENSSKAILDLTGGDVKEARKFVALLAIYSPQAKVDANSTFALRAWSQYKAGKPISVKTGVMDAKAKEALDDVDKFWSGEKTGNFFHNLLSEIDPATKGKQGATIDMWMMRAGQYDTDAPTATQYAFMENETNRLAAELGWEPQQVQAAIWVAMKARMENAGVKKAVEAKSEKRGWLRYDYPEKNGKPQKTRVILDAQRHRDNWLEQSFAHDPTTDDTQGAKFDFSDGVRRHIGQVSWEARPSRVAGILPGVHDAPWSEQVDFQNAVQRALLGPNGEDLLAQRLGLLVDGGDLLAPGVWQGDIAAGMQKKVAMAPAKGDAGKTTLDETQKTLLNTYSAVMGLLLRQDGVGWHRPFFSGTKAGKNGVELRIGQAFTPEQAKELWTAIDTRMRALGVADWEQSSGLIYSPHGMRVVNFGALEDNKAFRQLVESAAQEITHDKTVDPIYFTSDGNLVSNDWKANQNGQDFTGQIRDSGRSDLLGWGRDVLAPRVQAVFDEYSKKYGWGDPGNITDVFPSTAEVPKQDYGSERRLDQPRRGAIRFSDGKPLISLFEKADSSTLIHEQSHAWLEELIADASLEDAPQQLKDDLAKVREWLGNNGGELTDAQHEQFARAGEAYLMEGKAPSTALARVFSRFKDWLTKIYQTVKNLDTPINDDIRQVFDRLLATDAEIEQAKQNTGLEPAFKSREEAGMTTAEWKAYLGSIDKANQQAESTMLEKMMARVRRARSAEYREERKAVEADVIKQVDERPDMQALNLLRNGKMPDGTEEKIKLNTDDIKTMYGEDGASTLPAGVLSKDGVHPDLIAEILGFNSGDEMVRALQGLEKQQRELRATEGEKRSIRQYLVDQGVQDKIGDNIMDEASIEAEAVAALHGEARVELLATELRYLRRTAAKALEERGKGRKAVDQVKTEEDWKAAEADLMAKIEKAKVEAKGQDAIDSLKQQLADLRMEQRWDQAEENTAQAKLRESVAVTKSMLDGIRQHVDMILGNKTTTDVGRYQMYLRDERKAAGEVQKAILKKDWAEAAKAKQRQILSHILYTQAKEMSVEVDRGEALFNRMASKKSFGNIEQEYTDQMHDLLARFGFDSGRGEELQRGMTGTLEEFVKEKSDESGIELSVDPALFTLSKPFEALTMNEFRALHEAIDSMRELGRGEKMIEVDGVQRDFKEVISEITAAIRALGERHKSDFYDPADEGKAVAAKEKLFSMFRGIDAALTKPEALFDQIDKGNTFGIMNQAIFRKLKDAQGREDNWHQAAADKLKAAVEAAGKDWKKHMNDVLPDEPGMLNPETGRPIKLTRKRMLSMALNWGNEGQRTKLADGYKWDPKTIQQFLDKHMTKADWDFAQSIWNLFDSHKDDLDALQRRVTGVGLDMVKADPVSTKFGTYSGGYFPIVYDASKSYKAEGHAEKSLDAMFPNNYTRATTPKGSTISRVEGVKRPIQLGLDVVPWKIGQTIHDLAFREAIMDADRILSNDAVKKAFDDVFGSEYRKLLRPWLKHIANSKNIDDSAIGFVEKAISTARTNVVIVGIGFRLSTILKHDMTALANSIGEIGGKEMLKATADFYRPGRMKENWKFITDRSDEMKFRMNAYDKDTTAAYNKLLGNSAYTTFQKAAQHYGHIAVSYLDLGSAAPVWMASYRKGMAEGLTEKDAIYQADKSVRNAHGAQGITDTAAIQRANGAAKLVNMFYGFFNHIYNRQRLIAMDASSGIKNIKAGEYKQASSDFAHVLARSFWYIAVPALIEALVTHGGGPNENKDEGWGEFAAKAILSEIPAGIPILRDIAKAAIEGRDYEISPVAKMVSDIIHAGRDIAKVASGEDAPASLGKHVATAAGYLTGLPTAAPFTAGKFLWDINNGDADPQSLKEWYQGLTRGKVTQE